MVGMPPQSPDDESIGALVERVRSDRGKSQHALAELLAKASGNPSVTREDVSRWENGKRIPTPYWRRHLSAVLGIPLDVLDRAAAVAQARRAAAKAAADHQTGAERTLGDEGRAPAVAPQMAPMPDEETAPTLEEILDLWDELMLRRDFLAGSGGTVAAAFVPAVPAATTLPAGRDVAEAVKACAAVTAGYRRLDGALGPGAVYAQASEHHRQLDGWLRRTRNDGEWRQVAVVSIDASILLAWLNFDLAQYDEAVALNRHAFAVADQLGDPDLRAFLLGRMSRTLSECGQHTNALVFAEAAQRVAGTKASPVVRSWLAVTRAYVHACLGDDRACRAAADSAQALLDQATGQPAPSYLDFYGRSFLDKWAGKALLMLAERTAAPVTDASSVIDHALAGWSRSLSDSGEVLAACASARLVQREIGEAARLTGRVYDVAADTGSRRVLGYVTDLRRRLSPYRQTRAVRALDERLLTGRQA
jgi:transcriptional regulator with XRE-family HTH domain